MTDWRIVALVLVASALVGVGCRIWKYKRELDRVDQIKRDSEAYRRGLK